MLMYVSACVCHNISIFDHWNDLFLLSEELVTEHHIQISK